MKRLALAVLFSATAALATEPAAAPAGPAPQDRVVASINGEVITAGQLERMYRDLSPDLLAGYEKSGGRAQFLEYVVRKRLVLQEAVRDGFDRKPEVQEAMRAASEAAMFDRYIRDVVASRVVTESDLQAWYEAHKAEFTTPQMFRARHIVVTSGRGAVTNSTGDDATSKEQALQKIESIASAIQAGADFADMAAKFSEDASAAAGGELGWFPLGKAVPQVDQAVVRLGRGMMTEPIETSYGYEIVLLEDRREAGPAPLEAVKGHVRESVLRERGKDILAEVDKLSLRLRGEGEVVIHRENLPPRGSL